MNFKFLNTAVITLALSAASVINVANAGAILFAQDVVGGDTTIASVLSADGHSVTSMIGGFSGGINADLTGDLSAYDAIFWSASGTGNGGTHNESQFAALENYAFNGGKVYVTGYDSIAHPLDQWLINFVGGSSSVDTGSNVLSALLGQNSLTNGLFDIEGIAPTGAGNDRDGLLGLSGDTQCISVDSSSCQWSLRSIGSGEIAYVSAGWSGTGIETTFSDSDSAYHKGLRNFAHNAVPVPEPSTFLIFSLGLMGLGLRTVKK